MVVVLWYCSFSVQGMTTILALGVLLSAIALWVILPRQNVMDVDSPTAHVNCLTVAN